MTNTSSDNSDRPSGNEERVKSSTLTRIIFFFPFQLIFVHVKHNFLVLFLWFLLFGFVLGWLGTKYGMNYLFLYPEYLGKVNFWSFSLLGFSIGGFISAFNVFSYIKNGPEFPFIATLVRPFHKFSINNFLIPAFFIFVLIIKSIEFQYVNELVPTWDIILNIGGLFFGMFVFLGLSIMYFFRLNKNVYKISGKTDAYFEELAKKKKVVQPSPRAKKWYRRMRRKHRQSRGWRVETYLSGVFKLKLARDSSHYDNDLLKQVFYQNHLNASIFEISLFISFLMLGIFREVSIFIIPAGASVILLFTMILMLLNAFRSWFRGWTVPLLFGLFLIFNMISGHYEIFQFKNYAYGLNYDEEPAEYSVKQLKIAGASIGKIEKDLRKGESSLENWKRKTGKEKPFLIVVNSSGGGLRSALWNFSVLRHIDSVSGHRFYKNVQFCTGASGGMIGSAYFRELYLRQQEGALDTTDLKHYQENICKDLLNPVALSIATNDLFIRLKTCTDGKYIYQKDRGFTFENQLNINTDFVLDKRLADYQVPEHLGKIPIMLLSPTIVNDSRRLLIASQPMAYMSIPLHADSYVGAIEDVEFTSLFAKHDPYNVKFTSALRMNATFPYILPQASLPTEPQISVMDAGVRDNLGTKSTLKYINAFEHWIKENTRGVIIVQIRDTKRHFEQIGEPGANLTDRITAPLSSFYDNFAKIHDYNYDQLLELYVDHARFPMHVISFELEQEKSEKASLSFHLTQLEKRHVEKEIFTPDNQHQLKLLMNLLNN